MSLRFDPLLPWPVLAGVMAVLTALALAWYRPYARLVTRRCFWGLLACKLLALAVLAVLLANPYLLRRRPDPAAASVLLLLDATGSMQTKDCQGERRLDVLRREVCTPEAPFHRLLASQYGKRTAFLFAGQDLRRIEPGAAFDTLPGQTDVAEAVRQALASTGGVDAVVLATDGLSNAGRPLLEAATTARQAGVPIHCIGIGDTRRRPDLAARWEPMPDKPTKGKPYTLTGTISRNFTGDYAAAVTVWEDGREIATPPVRFTGDQQEQRFSFEHHSFVAGFRTFKLAVTPLADEENTVNNVDFGGCTVRDPELLRVFYFAGNLGWDYKFLQRLAAEQPRLQVDAAIRLTDQSWFTHGLEEKGKGATGGFPTAEQLNQYDCLVVAADSLTLLDEPAIAGLTAFVEKRGGGLILTGVVGELPPALRLLLPVKEIPARLEQADRAALAFRPTGVLAPRRPEDLREFAAQLYVPPGSSLYPLAESLLKPGAVVVAAVKDAQWPVLATQQCGAGKVALVNLNDTWQWVLNTDRGSHLYGLFWGRLVAWASSSAAARVTLRPTDGRLTPGEEYELTLDLLGADFAPATGAEVTSALMGPGGAEALSFFATPRVDGRYVAKFIPRAPGEYRLAVRAKLPSGEVLEANSDYIVVDLSPESVPAPLAEEQLKSLARLSGGAYWHYAELAHLRQLPVSQKTRFHEERHEWLRSWLFLLLVVLAVLPDWALRRHVGLR